MSSVSFFGLATMVLVGVAGLWAGLPAAAHGTLDQKLTGDPGCNTTNFKGFVSSTGALRQEFVPAASGLASVDLCLGILSADTSVTLNVRAGTSTVPGAILASVSTTVATPGTNYVHLDLATVLATTPGTKLVLEIPTSPTFQWRSTCAAVAGSCTSVDPDLYPAGLSNGGGDFAFRTFAGQPAATPTATATATPTMPPPPPTITPIASPTLASTPAPPTTGTGTRPDSAVEPVLWVVAVLMAASLAGMALASRRR